MEVLDFQSRRSFWREEMTPVQKSIIAVHACDVLMSNEFRQWILLVQQFRSRLDPLVFHTRRLRADQLKPHFKERSVRSTSGNVLIVVLDEIVLEENREMERRHMEV
jgi:hypothetical protein